MPILEALSRIIVDLEEAEGPDGEVRARGAMRFGAALRGPPGRLHGGHHAFARTLTILARLRAHEGAATFPCALDVNVQRALPLEEAVPYEATYRRSADGAWELTTRLLGTDRLRASARSLPSATLLDDAERERWRTLHAESVAEARSLTVFGVEVRNAPRAIWVEAREPRRTAPASQHAALVDAQGVFGAPFVCTQLDFMGAICRSTVLVHPHFTKHIELRLAAEIIAADTHLICLADRTTIEPDAASDTPPVEIGGERVGTVRVKVALFDAAFDRTYGTATVTAHPVDPAKFPALDETETRRAMR